MKKELLLSLLAITGLSHKNYVNANADINTILAATDSNTIAAAAEALHRGTLYVPQVAGMVATTLSVFGLSHALLGVGAFAGWRFHKRLVRIENITKNIDATTQTHLKEFRSFKDGTTSTLGQHTYKLNDILEKLKVMNSNILGVRNQTTVIEEAVNTIRNQQIEIDNAHQGQLEAALKKSGDKIESTLSAQDKELKAFIVKAIADRKPVTLADKAREFFKL